MLNPGPNTTQSPVEYNKYMNKETALIYEESMHHNRCFCDRCVRGGGGCRHRRTSDRRRGQRRAAALYIQSPGAEEE